MDNAETKPSSPLPAPIPDKPLSTSLPQPPFIIVPNVHNFRTVTSIPIASRRTSSQTPPPHTRANFIHRYADLHPLTPSGAALISSLGITTIFDFRSAHEVASRPYTLPETPDPDSTSKANANANNAKLTRVYAPVFVNEDANPAALAVRMAGYAEDGTQGFVRAYAEILDSGQDAYRVVFRHVLEKPDEGFLVHCAGGKDRTGVVVALMLSLVGVGDEEVAAEYALTEIGLREWMEEFVPVVLETGFWATDEERVRRALGSRREVMVDFLAFLREEWGGADGYLKRALGFGEEEVQMISMNLIEG